MNKIEYVEIKGVYKNVSLLPPSYKEVIEGCRKRNEIITPSAQTVWVERLMRDLAIRREEAIVLITSGGKIEFNHLGEKERRQVLNYTHAIFQIESCTHFQELPEDILEWLKVSEEIDLDDWKDFKKLKELTLCHESALTLVKNRVPSHEIIYLTDPFPPLKRDMTKRDIINAFYGKETPTWFEDYRLGVILGLSGMLKEADFNYLEEGGLRVGCFLKAGVSFRTVVSKIFGETLTRELSKNEIMRVAQTVAKGYDVKNGAPAPYGFTVFKRLDGVERVFGFDVIEDQHLFTEVLWDTKDLVVWKWCYRNLHNLAKKRTLKDCDGGEFVYHNTSVINLIDREVLEENPKMGWKKVMAKIKEKQQKDILRLAGENIPFPPLPSVLVPVLETNPDVVYIDTSRKLAQEGKDMEHCAGEYFDRCLEKMCYIFHVSDGTPSGATVEITPPSSSNEGWRVIQAMGKNNIHSDKAAAIMKKLLQSL